MGAISFQITSLMIVYSAVYSDADQSKHQSSASLAFVQGIHREPVNSPHKWPVTRKMFPFDDVIMSMGELALAKQQRAQQNIDRMHNFYVIYLGRVYTSPRIYGPRNYFNSILKYTRKLLLQDINEQFHLL